MSWANKDDLRILRKECSEIVDLYKKTNKLFYRGLKNKSQKEMVKIVPRTDRAPKDTTEELHDLADDFFKRTFGWKARSEGVFATPKITDAAGYEQGFGLGAGAHIIFPANGFKYVWSPEIQDAYENIFKDYEDESNFIDEWSEEYGPESENGEWKKGNKRINSPEELKYMINFDVLAPDEEGGYEAEVYFEKNGREWDEIWTWVPYVTLKDWISHNSVEDKLNSYMDTGIERAIYKENEVMFKCKYYYAIPTETQRQARQLGL